jgi:hypothetical protein
MSIEDVTPLPNQIFEPEQPIIVSAKLPNYKSLDPQSVGMALLSAASVVPYAYDPNDGSITLVVRDAFNALRGKAARALVWATELKSGRRVEASWTFNVPDAGPAPVTSEPSAPAQPNIGPETGSEGVGGAHQVAKETRAGTLRAPR